MLDLNHLRVFEKVASLKSFSAAACELNLPKSSVSRAIVKLEDELGARLFQRTTREVALTPTGEALRIRCVNIIDRVGEAVDYVGGLTAEPRGILKISAGVGFGINVLSEALPNFIRRYPSIDLKIELSSRAADLVSESVDVAIRMGPMPDSSMVAIRLGNIKRYLCAAPSYLEINGTPQKIEDLASFDAIEMPGADGRARPWNFSRKRETVKVDPSTRICVDEVLTLTRLVVNGAGLGILSGYLCEPEIIAGRLVRLLPEWVPPDVLVSLVFPSKRELAPTVRAFVDFMKEISQPGQSWQKDSLERNGASSDAIITAAG
jgi:LysR family transcriptional regulator, regulator for bpeEF and oprC